VRIPATGLRRKTGMSGSISDPRPAKKLGDAGKVRAGRRRHRVA
jgi:hypothetical protein